MHSDLTNPPSSKPVILAIGMVVLAYVVACIYGLPQQGTEQIRAAKASHGSEEHDDHQDEEDHNKSDDHKEDHDKGHADKHHEGESHDKHDEHDKAEDHKEGDHGHAKPTPPDFWTVTPFVILLGCIAVLPLINKTEHWWESNLHRFYVAGGLGVVTLLYYLILHQYPIEAHWPAHHLVEHTGSGLQWGFAWSVIASALLNEYIPFIVLLFSLYAISGGIRIEGNLAAHPLTNVAFIAVGGLLASFIGTTGAAMLLIRHLLETNKERKHVVHTVVFFIFVVCNCGGCLLPIGDPPLFLGYLAGVPFMWTMSLWKAWLFVNCSLLAIYWVWDHLFCYPTETKKDIVRDETRTKLLHITGWVLNAPLLVGVVFCVALLDPGKPLPGTEWHAPMYLREICQLALVGISLMLGSMELRVKNKFNYHAIIEVGALFLGIFVCMQPALQILGVRGSEMGITTANGFFWITGSLSAVLDNAPTYLVFFKTAGALEMPNPVEGTAVTASILTAISLGAVFMGAMTYIGNGPNFMVKAIAEASGIRMPSFFGYMKYSLCVLLPLMVITTLLFL